MIAESISSASFVYLVLMLLFGCITLMMALFGGGHDASGDVHVDHDVVHGHAEEGSQGWASWFSFRVISAFFAAFGAAGLISTVNGINWKWSLLISISSGVVLGYLIRLLTSYLRGQEGGGTYRREDLAGQMGTVTMAILEGGIGEVQFIVNGQLVTQSARSSDGKAIAQGARVAVDVVGSILLVKKSA